MAPVKCKIGWAFGYSACAFLGNSAFGGIIITFNFGGGLTATQQNVFSSAKLFWETALSGYKPGIAIVGPAINASEAAIDGVGGIPANAAVSWRHISLQQGRYGVVYIQGGTVSCQSDEDSNPKGRWECQK